MTLLKSFFGALSIALLLSSCNNTPSLQQYYVDQQENEQFLIVNVPMSTLNVNRDSLNSRQQQAFDSVEKLNILAFRSTPSNQEQFQAERETVLNILKDSKYKPLARFNDNSNKAVVSYIGSENGIDEVILFGSNPEQGFGIIRLLGNNMTPLKVAKLVSILEKEKLDVELLKGLPKFFNNNK